MDFSGLAESYELALLEEVDLHQPQKLLEALRRCLEARQGSHGPTLHAQDHLIKCCRKELSIKTQELLKEESSGSAAVP